MARASLAALMSLVPILDMAFRSLPVLPNDILECLADEALIRNSRPRRRRSHRVEQLPWQAHVDSLAFGLKLEAERPHAGQVIFGQVGLFNKLLGFLIAFEAWQFLFHNASFPFVHAPGADRPDESFAAPRPKREHNENSATLSGPADCLEALLGFRVQRIRNDGDWPVKYALDLRRRNAMLLALGPVASSQSNPATCIRL